MVEGAGRGLGSRKLFLVGDVSLGGRMKVDLVAKLVESHRDQELPQVVGVLECESMILSPAKKGSKNGLNDVLGFDSAASFSLIRLLASRTSRSL